MSLANRFSLIGLALAMAGCATRGGTLSSDAPILGMPDIAVEKFRALVPPLATGALCATPDRSQLAPGHRLLSMVFADSAGTAARQVTVWYDTAGTAYRYSDVRRDARHGAALAQSPQTTVSLDLRRQVGQVSNSPGSGQIGEIFRVRGTALADAASLGNPDALISRIWKECGQ